jgi:hypothetical protein
MDARRIGADQADWARLRDNTLRRIQREGTASFAEEFQAPIRAFYKRLLEEQ